MSKGPKQVPNFTELSRNKRRFNSLFMCPLSRPRYTVAVFITVHSTYQEINAFKL